MQEGEDVRAGRVTFSYEDSEGFLHELEDHQSISGAGCRPSWMAVFRAVRHDTNDVFLLHDPLSHMEHSEHSLKMWLAAF